MYFQEITVYIILAVTTFIALRNFYLSLFRRGNGGGCSGCSSSGSCSSFSAAKSSMNAGATLGIKLQKFSK